MADLKRRTFLLSTGKQIKLFGNSMAIGKSLEIGEGYAPNIFSCLEPLQTSQVSKTFEFFGGEQVPPREFLKEPGGGNPLKERPDKKLPGSVANPYMLTAEEMMEMADYNIRLWLDLKDNIRKHGMNSPKIFNRETLK